MRASWTESRSDSWTRSRPCAAPEPSAPRRSPTSEQNSPRARQPSPTSVGAAVIGAMTWTGKQQKLSGATRRWFVDDERTSRPQRRSPTNSENSSRTRDRCSPRHLTLQHRDAFVKVRVIRDLTDTITLRTQPRVAWVSAARLGIDRVGAITGAAMLLAQHRDAPAEIPAPRDHVAQRRWSGSSLLTQRPGAATEFSLLELQRRRDP